MNRGKREKSERDISGYFSFYDILLLLALFLSILTFDAIIVVYYIKWIVVPLTISRKNHMNYNVKY